MKIGIIGCGWLGSKIADYFKLENEIFVTTTSKTKEEELITKGFDPLVIHFFDNEIFEEYNSSEKIKELDILIITIPFSQRTSVHLLKNRFTNLCVFIDKFEKQLFLMSSIGIYPKIDIEITETTLADKYLNPSILYVENFMREKYTQINILRLGGLMGDDRIFSNYAILTSAEIVNHIHYEDICVIIKKMIDMEISKKTYNLVAPLHPTKNEIFNFQKENKEDSSIEKPFGRKVTSAKLQDELNYHFIRPNPMKFHIKTTAID